MLPPATRWRVIVGVPLLLAVAGIASFVLVRELTANDSKAGAELKPFWYVAALDEDAAKPRITQQTINGILVGPDSSLTAVAEACDDDLDGASPVPTDEVEARSAGTAVEMAPDLPDGVNLVFSEAAECNGVVINVVKRYSAEARDSAAAGQAIPEWAGGEFFVSRTLTKESQAPMDGAAERLSAMTIGGNRAVVLKPVMPMGYDVGIAETQIVIADGNTITVIQGRGMPFGEFIALAESLYAG